MISREIEELDLRNQRIEIRHDFFVGFNNLVSLNLSSKQLEFIPSSIYDLPRLKYLDISYNELEYIPLELGNISTLEEVDIKGNNTAFNDFFKYESPRDITRVLKFIMAAHNPPQERSYLSYSKIPQNQFSVLSYNILVPRCAMNYYLMPFSPIKYMETQYRVPMIINQLAEYANSIICLQEANANVFRQINYELKNLGYTGYHCPKGRYNQKKGSSKDEVLGQATFIDTNKFNIIGNHSFIYYRLHIGKYSSSNLLRSDDVCLLVAISPKNETDTIIIVANVHLTWEQNEVAEKARTLEIQLTINEAIKFGQQYSDVFDIIICGDFNTPCYAPTCTELKSSNRFTNSYEAMKMIPQFTQYLADNKLQCDHIFSTQNKLSIKSVLPVDTEYIQSNYFSLPSDYYPSDHIPIATIFEVVPNNHPKPLRPIKIPLKAQPMTNNNPIRIEKREKDHNKLHIELKK